MTLSLHGVNLKLQKVLTILLLPVPRVVQLLAAAFGLLSRLTIERAREITDARNRAVVECDIDAFLSLWSDDWSLGKPPTSAKYSDTVEVPMTRG